MADTPIPGRDLHRLVRDAYDTVISDLEILGQAQIAATQTDTADDITAELNHLIRTWETAAATALDETLSATTAESRTAAAVRAETYRACHLALAASRDLLVDGLVTDRPAPEEES
jgi:hypothetical protein